MKKHLIIATALLCSSFSVRAQEIEGVIRYLVIHNWSKKMAAVDYISKQQRERISYMWGNRSEWKMYTTMYITPTETKYEDSEERAEPDDDGYSWRQEVYIIKHNYAANTMQDVIQMLGKTYIIEDTLNPPDWKILNDLKEVAGHICMKASWKDTIKEQEIVAWFAMDIPVSAGPERFYGLPGLILEVDVNNGGMVVTADKIDLKKIGPELDLPKKLKGKKITEADYITLLKKHMKEKRAAEEPAFWGIRY
ncbi:MAG TPA: GLPGLI family protein [Saprospiraceae bacterium]|nr:GLPGLI family protein [Saprospiraceae bacterium]